MGGGVCWLDYDNDGWLDLFAVNSYADVDMPEWASHGGLPRSALFHNVHGQLRRTSARPSHAGIRVKGTGCVAADLNGDGYTDLSSRRRRVSSCSGTTATAPSPRARTPRTRRRTAGIRRSGRGRERRRPPRPLRRRLHEHGRAIPSSIAGFPTNHEGVRDLLFLNEGNGPDGRARSRRSASRRASSRRTSATGSARSSPT